MGAITKRERTNRKIAEAVSKKTPEVIKKLEEAFAIDASVSEAVFYAGISLQTYYNWVNADPELFERFTQLRQKPILLARKRVVDGIKESYSNAMDYLTRKAPEEFGNKSKVEVEAKVVTQDVTKDPVEARKIADEYEEKLRQSIANTHKKPHADSQ